MAITYPLSHPAAPGFRTAAFRPRAAVAVSESPFTLSQQVYEHQGQAWGVSLTLPPMKRAQAAAWVAFRLSLNGRKGTFLLGDPDASTPQGVATGTPLVNGASQTGQSLVTDGWTPSTTGILLAGDYIQLGTGSTSRLYMVLQDVDSDASGNATLDIWPRLRESPADNAAIVTTNCKGLFRMASNEMPWDTDEVSMFGISFDAVEAI